MILEKITQTPVKTFDVLNEDWSKSFKKWLASAQVRNILERQNYLDAEFDDWARGGCRVLGEVLVEELATFYPEHCFTLETLMRGETPTHIVVVVKGGTSSSGEELIIDGYGVRPRECVIEEFNDLNHESDMQPLNFARYDAELCDEWCIQTTPWKINMLRKQFKEFFGHSEPK